MVIKETTFLLLLIMMPMLTEAKKPKKPRAWAGNFYDAPSDNCKCCPSGWVIHENSCYYIDDTLKQNQNDARKTCQSMGGDLPIIKSAEVDKFIIDLIRKQDYITMFGAWIGLEKNHDDSLFYWIDGTPLAGQYQNWAKNEPNNNGGNEYCASYIFSYKSHPVEDVQWNDLDCAYPGGYGKPVTVCQKPL